ncbi:ABC transporter permease, partial [candidate division KSB1 bacterium]
MNDRKHKIPAFPAWILNKLNRTVLNEGYNGDLEEEFCVRRRSSNLNAGIWLYSQALRSIPGGISNMINNNLAMFKNYLKIAFRNIKRHKGFSFINIFGLAIGMTCCLLIFIYVMDEFSYDNYHEKGDRIYRITTISSIGNATNHYAITPHVLAATLSGEIPEIESYTRLDAQENLRVRYNGRELDIREYFIADTSFFNIFTYQFISGNPQTALTEPNSIVITEETAQRIFDDEEAYGKYLAYADSFEVRVSGVIRNVPKNSHFTFDAIRPVTFFRHYHNIVDSWRHDYFAQLYSYILVREDADLPTLEAKIRESVHNHFSQVYAERGTRREYPLQRLKDIHLRSKLGSETSAPGDIKYVYLFSMVAFLILCIASINFINLSTARSTIRAREVGLRKVFGGVKWELMKQFLGESLIITFISMILCILFVLASLPVFNQLTGKMFTTDNLINITSVTGLFIIFIATGLLAGSFPAFILTSFDPVRVLKGNLSARTGKNVFRKIMVLLQFSISVFMIISVIVILKQMDYIFNKDLGYDTDKIVVINSRGHGENILRNPIMQIPSVESISFSYGIPGVQPGSDVFSLEGGAQNEAQRTAV